MKKAILIIAVLLTIATPSSAINVIDTMLYRKDVLRRNNTPILVNRLTGEVKYMRSDNGTWEELTGLWKKQCQALYKAQSKFKRR